MPKILIFSTTYLPFVGGAEMAVKEITDRLDNFHFDLITARLDRKLVREERIGKINVYRVGWGWILDKYLFSCLAYFKAKKLHQKKNYQIVQAIMAFYAGLAALFFKWKYPQVKYLLTMQSGDSDFFIWWRTWFWYPIYKRIYTKSDYIQAISRFLIQRARKYTYQGKFEVVPNGVDLEKFRKQDIQTIQDLKSELKIRPDKKVIITVSRLVKKNGLNDLIKAGQYLDFPFKILIIGSGPNEKKLKRLAKRLNLEERILFLGHIQYDDLPKYYSIADVFVRPSLSEGLGSVFLEAMAVGLPIIGPRIGGIPDFLNDGETGYFCQVKNPKSIAEKINYVLNTKNKEEIAQVRKNIRRLIEEKYSWSNIVLRMRNIFNKLTF